MWREYTKDKREMGFWGCEVSSRVIRSNYLVKPVLI